MVRQVRMAVLIGATISLAGCNTAPGPAGTSTAKAPSAAPAREQLAENKICRMETGTGSVMPRRVCRTKAEWDALATPDEDKERWKPQ